MKKPKTGPSHFVIQIRPFVSSHPNVRMAAQGISAARYVTDITPFGALAASFMADAEPLQFASLEQAAVAIYRHAQAYRRGLVERHARGQCVILERTVAPPKPVVQYTEVEV